MLHDAAAWTEVEKGQFEASGYRIRREKVNDVWLFLAWAPLLSEATFEALRKIRYQRGERVPQRRELLGVFVTSEAARLACVDHFREAAA